MTISTLSKSDIADCLNPLWEGRLASAGLPFGCVEVMLKDGNGYSCASDRMGEIVCRGDVLMSGYWKNEQGTAEALKDGWLHTGDIGVFDRNGYLFLKDRSKDLIISGGSNIYPREVEEILLQHPRVLEASVIGRPDREWGEVVVAYIVGETDGQELDSFCLDRIARFKRPKDYVFVSALPKNNNGKILKSELRTLDLRPVNTGGKS